MVRRWLHVALLGVVAITGCADLREYKINQRNKYLAHRAWDCNAQLYHEVEYPDDFARGFEKGYYDVACGGNGCVPALPPRRYWTVTYASPVGHRRTHAWFEGYKYGAAVAEQDGVGVYITVPTGHPSPPPPIDLKAIMGESQEEKPAPSPNPAVETEPGAKPTPDAAAPKPQAEEPGPTPEPEKPEASTPAPPKPAPPGDGPAVVRPQQAEPKSATPKNSTVPKTTPKTPAREMPVAIPDDSGSARLFRSR